VGSPDAEAPVDAGRVLGPPLKSQIPWAPLPHASARENGTPGVWSPTTPASSADPVRPGVPRPGTFRLQGLTTLLTACSPPSLATVRRPPQRPWGLPFRALLLPAGGAPLGASPLLSFPRSARRPAGRDSRGCLQPGRGTTRRRPKAPTAEPCPPGCSPLQGILLRRGGTGFPAPAPPALRPEVLPTVYFRTGLQGLHGESGWSLSRLPAFLGFCTFPIAVRLGPAHAPGSWLHLGPLARASETS